MLVKSTRLQLILLCTIALTVFGANAAPIDAHRKVVYDFAVTNDCAETQTIATIKTSCACLKAEAGGGALGDRPLPRNYGAACRVCGDERWCENCVGRVAEESAFRFAGCRRWVVCDGRVTRPA